MKYSFVEIGTADFDTLIQSANDEVGLTIEPLRFYLNNLPNKPNVKKINAAISDKEGFLDVFYVPKETIREFRLPEWISGCNSLGKPHETVSRILKERNLSLDLVRRENVKVITPRQLVEEYEIESIDMLKIDTEGHDCIIINTWLDTTNILPKKIKFESNVLTPLIEITKVMRRLALLGYHTIEHGDDTLMELRRESFPRGRETLVSFIYDIGNDMKRFLDTHIYWEKLNMPSIIFTEPKYCSQIPKNCFVIPMLLSEFESYKHLKYAERAFEGPMKAIKYNENLIIALIQNKFVSQEHSDFAKKVFENQINKFKPIYSVMTWSKFNAMEYAIKLNPFGSEIFTWFDYGLWKFRSSNPSFGNFYMLKRILNEVTGKIKICRMHYNVEGVTTDSEKTGFAGGFMAGSVEYWKKFIERFIVARDENVSKGFASLEEHIIGNIKRDDIFDEYYGWYSEILDNIEGIKKNHNYIFGAIIQPAIENRDFALVKRIFNLINRETLSFEDYETYETLERLIKNL